MQTTDTKKRKTTEIDLGIGSLLRIRRITLGLTQENLANAVDVSIQQIQKYEKGTNRIAGSKLYKLAHFLKVPIKYFFDSKSSLEEEVELVASERELLALIRSYNKISPVSRQKKVLALLEDISNL